MLPEPSTPHSVDAAFTRPIRSIGDLPTYQYDVAASTPVEKIVEKLKRNPELPGVLLHEDAVFMGGLSRLKIFEWLGRPYGVELFFKKSAANLYGSMHRTSNEIFPSDMKIGQAVQKALSRPPEIRYDPVVVSFGEKGLRMLDMNLLLLAQSDQLSKANHVIEKQIEIGRVLSSSLELPRVLALVLEQMESIIPYHRAAILLYRNEEMEFAASRGYPQQVDMEEARILVNNNRIFTRIMQQRKPSLVKDTTQQSDWQHIAGVPPTRSWLGVPLIQNDQVLGMLSISRLEVMPFTPEEVEISAIFAGQAGAALGNANLYQQIQLFNQELEARVQERTQDLQKAYSKLEILDKSKSDFIKVSSHEIKTPITVISGYAQILLQARSLEEEQRGLVRNMMDGVRRLGEIVNTMLDVARLDTQGMELIFNTVNLQFLLSDVTKSLQPSLSERRIDCQLENLSALPACRGDLDALRKAFHHLIINAIKYTPDGGRITVSGQVPGRRNQESFDATLQITVSDTGIGIDPKNHELIFDKFFQTGQIMLHSSGKTKFKGGGSGLGLAVARGVVEAHGGQIWVESAGQDEVSCPGSAFHVILPIAPPARATGSLRLN